MNEFGRLIEQEIPRLRRYARALTRDIGQADDLVQSCLVRALAKEHLWQPGTNLRVWLFTVLHNEHINGVRRSLREQGSATAASACLARSQSAPSARLDLLDVERAFGKLPELQRRVLLLIGLEGIRYDEAAEILGVPIGTVQSRIGRARQTLRKLLEHDIDSAGSFDGEVPYTRSPFPVPCPSEHWKTPAGCQTSPTGSEVNEDNRFTWLGPTRIARGLERAAHPSCGKPLRWPLTPDGGGWGCGASGSGNDRRTARLADRTEHSVRRHPRDSCCR
jgi:RNA polymerase sigma-70 factor, ECF subfamily